MRLKALWITSWFPTHKNDKRFCYMWDSLDALRKFKIEPIILLTKTWRPKFEKIDYAQFPVEIKTCYYLSIPRHYFRSLSNFSYLFHVVPEIKKLYKSHQFDIIHAHGEICGLAAVMAAKQLQVPAVVTIHGVDTCERMRKGYAAKMFRNMFNQANKVIYVSEFLKKNFHSVTDNDLRYCVVHNGFRLPTIPCVYRTFENQKPVRLISVSFLHEGKGVDLTLQALGKIKKAGVKNWIYTIIGSGYLKKYCEEIIAKFDLKKEITFVGDLYHNEVYEHLQNADIFCLPSYREAFGIAYAEAMAHGLLTIGVKGQGPEAFIIHGKTGLLVAPRDVNHLAETLHTAITHFKEMKEIADIGKQYILENFTWKKHAERLYAIYQEAYHE